MINFNRNYIFNQKDICSLELTGECVIKGLLDIFVDDFINFNNKETEEENKKYKIKRDNKLYYLISHSFKDIIKIESGVDTLYDLDDYFKLRLIVDFISGMTDNFALKLYQNLNGIQIG